GRSLDGGREGEADDARSQDRQNREDPEGSKQHRGRDRWIGSEPYCREKDGKRPATDDNERGDEQAPRGRERINPDRPRRPARFRCHASSGTVATLTRNQIVQKRAKMVPLPRPLPQVCGRGSRAL